MHATFLAGGLYRGITRLRSASILSAALSLTLVAGGLVSCTSTPAAQKTASLTLSPADATVTAGGTLDFTATADGMGQAITWFVDGVEMGNATLGTLELKGSALKVTYAAPAAAGTHTVKVVGVDALGNPVTRSNKVTVTGSATTPPPTTPPPTTPPPTTPPPTTPPPTTPPPTTPPPTTPPPTTPPPTTPPPTTPPPTTPPPTTPPPTTPPPTTPPPTTPTPTDPPPTGSTVDPGPLAAFPGCEGMGGGATGGRGGAVYTVNTLEDTVHANVPAQNGPKGAVCSLRDAMTKTGPRTIVFSVGGTITLHSTMWPVPPGLTIAGQTAPGGGIQVRGDGTFGTGGALLWYSGNTIIRYLRIRPGNAPANASQQGLTGLATNDDRSADVVLDHNSFEWDGNKAAAFWSAQGVFRSTFSWNLVAECMAPHSTGLLVGGDTMGQANMNEASWDGHHNVLATIDHRLPQTWLKYGRWINNYVSGYGYAMLIRGGTQFDIIGNVWDGINTGLPANAAKNEVRWADTPAHNENQIVSSGTAQIYMSNNFGPKNPLGSYDNFSTMLRLASNENGQLNDAQVDTKYKASSPVIPSALNAWPITITPLTRKEDLKALLAPKVGANRRLAPDGSWVDNRDPVDSRIINYFLNPASSPTSLVTTAGPYPSLAAGTPPVDTDGDGMPDVWEDAHGLDKNDASDRNVKRPNARGYTNLELYLSGLYPNGTPLP
ncbi:hypothetical protein [Geothrix sp. 21YS21S-2]|uniref:hypothetical protein n=1 Tax=Geothrix sp. 21YS21S-2 TaxID=3068893 RepID=UPI0027BAD7C0|nr:hypothetical protein [Geothrix sp. 21YS21S-2]